MGSQISVIPNPAPSIRGFYDDPIPTVTYNDFFATKEELAEVDKLRFDDVTKVEARLTVLEEGSYKNYSQLASVIASEVGNRQTAEVNLEAAIERLNKTHKLQYTKQRNTNRCLTVICFMLWLLVIGLALKVYH